MLTKHVQKVLLSYWLSTLLMDKCFIHSWLKWPKRMEVAVVVSFKLFWNFADPTEFH